MERGHIYAPTLVIAGQYDTWSCLEDREGLMRDLVHAPVKQSVLIPDATHFVLFEKNRIQFLDAILKFLAGVAQRVAIAACVIFVLTDSVPLIMHLRVHLELDNLSHHHPT